MSETYLFACGTLRKDYSPKPQVNLEPLRFVCEAKVEGRLYDLGAYPGATDGDGEILGDVFEVRSASETFKDLDDYEGADFIREKVAVQTTDGNRITAWMYRYNCDVSNKRVIENGDYLAYLKTKDSLR